MPKPINFKQSVQDFKFDKPDFTKILPYLVGESQVNLEDFGGELIGKFNAIKTLWQLSLPEKPKSRSRVWKSTNGYIFLVPWANANLLRILAIKWFSAQKFSKSPLTSHMGTPFINRLEAQILDALRSVIANIEEGFARPTTSEYLQFLGYSQASLKEAKGNFQRAVQDGFLNTNGSSSLYNLGINLKDWHEALKELVVSRPIKSSTKGNYGESKEFRFNYPPVDNLDTNKLTYEIFIELINKTDWNLRKLVESLEKKLDDEKMHFKVEHARIKVYAKGGRN